MCDWSKHLCENLKMSVVTTSQKGCQFIKKNNQNWINVYVLPFKTMTFMASCCFFIHMYVNEFKQKNSFNDILYLSFGLKPLKVNIYDVRQESILQRTIKMIHQ
jgi:hypothetical protein